MSPRSPLGSRTLAGVLARLCTVAILCTAVGASCGDGSTASSSTREAVRGLMQKSHLVAVAYRSFGAAQQDCVDKFIRGALKSDADGAACIDDGLTASQLAESIERLREQVLDVAEGPSADCRTVARKLATLVQREEDAIHALHDDLANLDGRAFNRDFQNAGLQASHEKDLVDPLFHACA